MKAAKLAAAKVAEENQELDAAEAKKRRKAAKLAAAVSRRGEHEFDAAEAKK